MKQIFVILIFILAFNNLKSEQVIFINELMAKNDSFVKDDEGKYTDWIEIYNSSLEEVDLGGYYLSDDKDTLAKWKIPTGTLIAGKGYYIFWASGEPENGNRHTNFKLSADGETLALVMPDGVTKVDTLKFGMQEANISFGRVSDGAKNSVYFVNPTFGTANKSTASETLPVIINEIMASNTKTIQDETGAYEDWVELYNNSNEEIDISGFYLTDEPVGNPSKWRIPSGTVLVAKGHLLIWTDSDTEDGPYHADFKLSKDGDSIAIFAKDGLTLVNQVAFGSQANDISWGRKYDGAVDWMFFTTPTPGDSNDPLGVEQPFVMEFQLRQNVPNPFNATTTINVNLEESRNIKLLVYDYMGRLIETLYEGNLPAGLYPFTFTPENMKVGIYYCHLISGNQYITKIMVLE